MKKSKIISILKTIYKDCVEDPRGDWHRTDCILHKYFEYVADTEKSLGWCFGGDKCTEIQKILGLDSRKNWCPAIHKDVYDLVKNYGCRNIKI